MPIHCIIGYCACMGIYCVERVLLAELPELAHNIFPYKCSNLFIIYFVIVLHNFPFKNIVFIKFFDSICLFQTLISNKNVFLLRTVLSRNFSTLSFDDVIVDDVTVARDMLTKRMATGHRFSTLQNFIINEHIC